MSRVGKLPINLPPGVNVTVQPDSIKVEGPKGALQLLTMPGVKIQPAENQILVTRDNNEPPTRAKHGLTRTLLNNMVEGVSKGFEKKLEIHGVGYRVQLQGNDLKFNLGFSHDVIYKMPPDVQAAIEQNTITIAGVDKQRVGQIAAEIRALKKPEPYKGKGIRYGDERIIRKSGKSGKEG